MKQIALALLATTLVSSARAEIAHYPILEMTTETSASGAGGLRFELLVLSNGAVFEVVSMGTPSQVVAQRKVAVLEAGVVKGVKTVIASLQPGPLSDGKGTPCSDPSTVTYRAFAPGKTIEFSKHVGCQDFDLAASSHAVLLRQALTGLKIFSSVPQD